MMRTSQIVFLLFLSVLSSACQQTPTNPSMITFSNQGRLMGMDSNGQNLEVILNEPLSELSWSSDGRYLLYVDLWTIKIRDMETGTDREVHEIDNSNVLHEAPELDYIVFVEQYRVDLNFYSNLYTVNVDTGELLQLTEGLNQVSSPAWSPDGQWIAFAQQVGRYNQIFLIRPDGTDKRQLTNNSAHTNSPDWSPDSQSIVFVTDGSVYGQGDLRVLKVEDRTGYTLIWENGSQSSPAWSPDGQSIVFVEDLVLNGHDVSSELFIVDANGENLRRLTTSDIDERNPSWRPNPQSNTSD